MTFSPIADLARWREETGLACDLLCDATREMAMAYGAADGPDQAKAARLSVLVDAAGMVKQIYAPQDMQAHAAEVLADL